MPKGSTTRRAKQGQSSIPRKHRRSRGRSQEPSADELLMLGLTPEQWALVLDPCHRGVALRLALKISNHVVSTDALMSTAQEALIAAVRAYDSARDASFAEYAHLRMSRAMHEHMRARQIPERFLRWRKDLVILVAISEEHVEH